MAKTYDDITPQLSAWIGQQHMFFVATAPLAGDGHINASPKGLDCFRIVSPRQVAYLDVTGSGAETVAHLRENGRIVVMFCAFTGPPKIVRLHGMGRVVTKASSDWSEWNEKFPPLPGARAVIVIEVQRVSDSCGHGVPKMDFKEDRDAIPRWVTTKGEEAMTAYRLERNARSLDGLPALDSQDA